MDKLRIGELYTKLKPRILELINTIGGGTGPFAPTPHGLNSPHHTGSLDDTQAPQFLKIDGTRDLIGNLNVANGITIDGVDISALSAAYDAHLITDAHTIYAHAEGSGTRRAYEAGRLNKSILAGNGLTGGGLLTTDQTLSVLLNASWSGLSVDGNGLRINTAAAFTWTNDHVFQGLTKTRHLQPELTDTYDLGTSTLLWRKGWLSELDAILFAQNTVTLLGGWLLISKDEGAIDADVAPADTQINFGKAMTSGDFVLFRAAGKVEYMQVGSLVSGTTYNVTRNLDGSGANSWPAGTPFAVLGQSGQGRIELNAYDTPRIQLIRQGATYNAQTEIIRIGDLNGNWGYTSQKWGVAIGEYASGKANITIDQDGVLRIRNYTTDIIKLSGTDATLENVLKIAGTSSAIAIGNPPPASSTVGTGLWIDRTGLYGLQSNVRQAYFGSDGKLYGGGGNVYIDSEGIKIKQGLLIANKLTWVDDIGNEFGHIFMYDGGGFASFNIYVSTYPLFYAYVTPSIRRIGLDSGLRVGNSDVTGLPHGDLWVEGKSQFRNSVQIINGGLSLSNNGALSTTNYALQLMSTSLAVNFPNHISLFNRWDTLQIRQAGGGATDITGNMAFMMPLTFGGIRACWFTHSGFVNQSYYDVLDISPNAIPMTRVGGTQELLTFLPSGNLSYEISLNGSSDYFYRTLNAGLETNNWIAFCAWVRLDSPTRSHGICRAGTTTMIWNLLYFYPGGSNGYFEFGAFDTGNTYRIFTQVNSIGGWHCVGIRYGWASSTNFVAQLFLDGTFYNHGLASFSGMRAGAGNFELGRAGSAGTYYLDGIIPVAWFSGSNEEEMMLNYYNMTKAYFISGS